MRAVERDLNLPHSGDVFKNLFPANLSPFFQRQLRARPYLYCNVNHDGTVDISNISLVMVLMGNTANRMAGLNHTGMPEKMLMRIASRYVRHLFSHKPIREILELT